MLLLLSLVACGQYKQNECDEIGSFGVNIAVAESTPDTPSGVELYSQSGESLGDPAIAPITGLAAGDYVLAARTARAEPDASGFSTAWGMLNGNIQTVAVCGETTLDLNYETLPHSRHLIASQGESVAMYSPESLDAGSGIPDLRLDIPGTNDLRGVAVDPLGNLWVATSDTYGTRLLVFNPQRILDDGDPILSLSNATFNDHASISDIAFGADGNLIVSVRSSWSTWEGLLTYNVWPLYEALIEGGQVALLPAFEHPASTGTSLADIAFDAAGDLWTTGEGVSLLFRIGSAELAGTEAFASDAQLAVDLDGSALRGPTDLAFAPDGTLIVDYWTDGHFVRLDAAALATVDTATVVPAQVWPQDVLGLPSGLAITGLGDAWTADSGGFRTLEGGLFVPTTDLPPATDLVIY